MADKSKMQRVKALRLAFRQEGEFVNCYLAHAKTMDDAELLGSMRKSICDNNREVWENWKILMQESLSTAIAEVFGAETNPEFIEEPAPEHERAGHS